MGEKAQVSPTRQPELKMNIRPIQTEADYQSTLSRIEVLMDAAPNSADEIELDALATLVEAYEERHFPIPDIHPLEVIKFIMGQNNMTDADLIPYIGSPAQVSDVMSGRKPLTIDMIRRLHSELNIPAELLIKEYDAA